MTPAEQFVTLQTDGKNAADLTFKWDAGTHNVWMFLHKSEYDSCNFDSAIEMGAKSPYIFSTTTPGLYYFGCGIYGHCDDGQKLTLKVIGEQ